MNLRSPSKELARGPQGFTLIEVLISLFLLVLITYGVYQATAQTYRMRESIISEGDFYNNIRLAMKAIERDYSLLYTPIGMLPPKKPSSTVPGAPGAPPPPTAAADAAAAKGMEELLASDAGRTTKFWTAAIDVSGVRPSRLQGRSDRMSFVAASHQRLYKEAQESEFAKITYELDADTWTDAAPGTKVLVKLSETSVFDDETKERPVPRILLRGVKDMRIRYYRKDKDSWSSSWDTESQDTKNIYPDAVEVSITVVGSQKLSFEGTYKMRSEIPTGELPSTF